MCEKLIDELIEIIHENTIVASHTYDEIILEIDNEEYVKTQLRKTITEYVAVKFFKVQ